MLGSGGISGIIGSGIALDLAAGSLAAVIIRSSPYGNGMPARRAVDDDGRVPIAIACGMRRSRALITGSDGAWSV
ncbi:hypothetical protein ACG83_31955 [Frankia sp. R43]|uniref:hypothetical protein n=1 Tax=Frankia sp. R43 TaxID=269536 RepID=UPI0006CA1969|nr:hypothetical protein [Frankia sp. R43]KPM52133.1 hypothetical protein ACG83_31955 [Frankia sp. R43]